MKVHTYIKRQISEPMVIRWLGNLINKAIIGFIEIKARGIWYTRMELCVIMYLRLEPS